MAKTEYIRDINIDTAKKACEMYSAQRRYPNLSVTDEGVIEMYSGNSRERQTCREFILEVSAKMSAAKPQTSTVEAPATARQISYLESLIDNDPAAAMALNLSTDSIKTLAKSKASHYINQLETF